MILFSSPICTYVALIDREKKDDKTVTVLRRKGIKGILIHFDSILSLGQENIFEKSSYFDLRKSTKRFILREFYLLNLEENLSSIVKFSNAYSSRVSSRDQSVYVREKKRNNFEIKASLKHRYLFKNRWKRMEIVNGNLIFALLCDALQFLQSKQGLSQKARKSL